MIKGWEIGEYQGIGAIEFPVYPIRTVIIFSSIIVVLIYLSLIIKIIHIKQVRLLKKDSKLGIDLDILMILTLVGMLLAIFSGVHIALALGATAMIGTYFIFEDMYMAASQVGGAAYELN